MADKKRGNHDPHLDQDEHWDASRVLELELESRDQERIAVARLVDAAQRLVQGAIRNGQRSESLMAASGYLTKASEILKWPLPFAPGEPVALQSSAEDRAALLQQVNDELDMALASFAANRN